jgi:hypothetical protein
MANQHRKIATYRELSQDEIDSINSVKLIEIRLAALWDSLSDVPGVDRRDLALARAHFEDGCIRAVRAVARPTSPFNKE